MQAIFFVPLGLGVLLVIALLAAYVYALRRPSGEAVVYAATDFSSPAGFNVVSLPQDEILTRGQNLLWDSRLAELEFFAEPGWRLLLRICAAKGDLNLEDWNSNYDQRSVGYVGRIRVTFLESPGGSAMALWTKNGFDYALYFETYEMGLPSGLVDDFIKETDTVAA